MRIKVYTIPKGYWVKRWGHIGNQTQWWYSSSMAYLERRILLRFNPRVSPESWLVYYDGKRNRYTILEQKG